MTDNKHILFIHIPKTAGTSFRVAAEEYFGKESTFYDYSPHFKDTSTCVLEMIYEEEDYYKLYNHISKLDKSFLSGHFPTNKYGPLYDTLNIVSFVRNPVEQVLSHYNHYKNVHGYDKDLNSFIEEPRFRNVQSKILRGKPISFYGFIGLTEEYETSINMFNAFYSTNLKIKHVNVKKKDSLNVEDIDEDVLERIVRLNQKDIELYETVKRQFEVRKALYEKGLPFTYGIIQKKTEQQISGIAFQCKNIEAIEIEIYVDDKYIDTVLAKNLRPGQRKVPRSGYIGFDYIYAKEHEDEGILSAIVKETRQEII